MSLTISIVAGPAYSWSVQACTGPGAGDCSAPVVSSFTIRSTDLVIDTLSYFLTTHPDHTLIDSVNSPPTAAPYLRQIQINGQNKAYFTKWDPSGTEIYTWDNNNIYLVEDHSASPPNTAAPAFPPSNVWMKRQMTLGVGQISPATGLLQQYIANPYGCTPSTTLPWSATLAIEGHVPAFNAGGDLGVQDVIIFRNDWGSAFERTYWSHQWGWIRWESYVAGDLVPRQVANFNIDGNKQTPPVTGFPPGPTCTETHNAIIVSTSVPSTMIAGHQYSVSVTVQNTGTRIWTPQLDYFMGCVGDCLTWGSGRTPPLDPGDAIAQNQTKTFSWTVTAPSVPGSYNFNWQMVQTQWFGQQTNMTVTVQSAPRPIVVANYFISHRNEGGVIGSSVTFTPASPMLHDVGSWHNSVTKDYWASGAGTGSQSNLSYGPGWSVQQLQNTLIANNGWSSSQQFLMKINWTMMIEGSNAFSASKVATVNIFGTGGPNGNRQIYSMDLYPQDFQTPYVFQTFSLWLSPGAIPTAAEQLQFRVLWYGNQAVDISTTSVAPLAFTPTWSGWNNVSWNGGSSPSDNAYRVFNPEKILTSNYSGNSLSISPRTPIDWWRRDIEVGHAGDYPYIGPYDQNNLDFLRYDIRRAKAAGINAFKVYMYLPHYPGACDPNFWYWTDPVNSWSMAMFKQMLTIAGQEGFKLFIDDSNLSVVNDAYYTAHGQSAPYTYQDSECNAGILAKYLDDPAYLKINGQPAYGMPIIYERQPSNITSFVQQMNQSYKNAGGTASQLYSFVTPMTGFATIGEETNVYGPYDMQFTYLAWNGPPDNTTPNTYSYEMSSLHDNYATCNPDQPTADPAMIMNSNQCQCKYVPGQLIDSRCLLQTTLLQSNPAMAGFRNMPGVSSLFDWTAGAALVAPRFLYWNGSQYVWGGTPDTTSTAQMFNAYVQDAHASGYGATLTISPDHDDSGALGGPSTDVRLDVDGSSIRFQRMVSNALAAGPDVIMIENWNGWGEAVQIEPSTSYQNSGGAADPYLYLKILAQALGTAYQPPCIPPDVVDPLRLSYLSSAELCQPSYQPPVVSAGRDQTITLPSMAALNGTVTLGSNSIVSSTWSALSGPGNVVFASTSALVTTAGFSQPGTYGLQLSVYDGQSTVTSSMTVTVNSGVCTPGNVSVTHFGAAGNGTTDDAPAIQHAIDSLPSCGGTVTFPAGTYLLATPQGEAGSYNAHDPMNWGYFVPIPTALLIHQASTTLQGAGIGQSILKLADQTKMSVISSTAPYGTIEDLTVDGNADGRLAYAADGKTLLSYADQQSNIVNGLVTGWEQTVGHLVVQRVEIRNGLEDGAGAFLVPYFSVLNCHIHDNGGYFHAPNQALGAAGASAISLSGGPHSRAIGNLSERNTYGLWAAFGSNDVTIQNNTLLNNSFSAMVLGGDATSQGLTLNTNYTITGNDIENNTGESSVYRVQNATFSNNIVLNNAAKGLTFYNDNSGIANQSANWTITNSTFSNTTPLRVQTAGIFVVAGGGQNLNIRGNVIKDNGSSLLYQTVIIEPADANADIQTVNTLSFTTESVTAMSFSAAGTSPLPQTLTLSASGNTPFNWNASSDASWLSASPNNGSVAANGSQSVTVSVSIGPLGVGTYTGHLTINDLSGAAPLIDTVTFMVTAPANSPLVSAGADQTIALPSAATLNGTITPGSLSIISSIWSILSGPGNVVFSSTYTAMTTASFSAPGIYGLQLSVSDGQSTVTSSMTVTVNASTGTPATSALPTPDLSSLNDKTFTLQDTLSLTYGSPATGFNWEFEPTTPLTPAPHATFASVEAVPSVQGLIGPIVSLEGRRSQGISDTAPVSTPAPRLSLGGLSLAVGQYMIQVQAINGSQTSPWSAPVIITLVETDFSAARVYPNPWRAARGDGDITFDQLPAGSTVKIFTVSGRWVTTLSAPAGRVPWNLANDSGDKVASGIYLYLITDGHGNKTRGKCTVIR